MKHIDIILSGVGGQGILSIATVLGQASVEADLFLKQSEVHGMSQRGGQVQSDLRLSDCEIQSDLIPLGKADMIISMEPMEALRYLPYLKEDGTIISSAEPFNNIPNYPDYDLVLNGLKKRPNVHIMEIEKIAKENQFPKSANMILLGMAASFLNLFTIDQIKKAIETVFASKGEKIVSDNIKAFEIGLNSVAVE